MSDPTDPLFAWLEALDDLSYYEVLGAEPEATPDAIRAAFHDFCGTFHPDVHAGRPDEERRALSTIFKRGAEAHVVLTDPAMRAQYDAQLGGGAGARPARVAFSARPPPSGPPGAARRLEDAVRSPSVRPFARRAEELAQQGDLRQARLQLVLANHMEPGNEALSAALHDLDSRLAKPRT